MHEAVGSTPRVRFPTEWDASLSEIKLCGFVRRREEKLSVRGDQRYARTNKPCGVGIGLDSKELQRGKVSTRGRQDRTPMHFNHTLQHPAPAQPHTTPRSSLPPLPLPAPVFNPPFFRPSLLHSHSLSLSPSVLFPHSLSAWNGPTTDLTDVTDCDRERVHEQGALIICLARDGPAYLGNTVHLGDRLVSVDDLSVTEMFRQDADSASR